MKMIDLYDPARKHHVQFRHHRDAFSSHGVTRTKRMKGADGDVGMLHALREEDYDP